MLGSDRNHGIRKVVNGLGVNPEVESDGIRSDIVAAVWGGGTVPPTASAEVWRGRIWTDASGALWYHTGAKWVRLTPLVAAVSSQNAYTVEAASYCQRVGDMVHFAAVVNRAAGITAVNVCSIPAAFAPSASVTLAGIASQGGAAQLATVVVNADGTVKNWTAAAPNTNLAFSGAWKAAA